MATAPFSHLVVLMLENRSFDHVLGALGRDGRIPIEVASAEATNPDLDGNPIALTTSGPVTAPDLPHDFASVATALNGTNSGFVVADQVRHRGDPSADPHRVMSYFATGALPVTHALAEAYATCDQWFCSVPAETWPNRLFAIAASSAGRVTNSLPFGLYDLKTVFGGLRTTPWVIYNDQLPNATLVRDLAFTWLAERHDPAGHFRSIQQFEDDAAAGRLPAYAFIEPIYLGPDADDAHPPHPIDASEALVGRIYAAIRHSPNWPDTLFVVLYDEHGGYFDHVPPPRDAASPTLKGEFGFGFRRLGPRVPAILISSRLAKGSVVRPPAGTYADHTTVIATALQRANRPALTARDGAAWNLLDLPWLPQMRHDDNHVADVVPGLARALAPAAVAHPLSAAALDGRSGRDVAALIAAHQETNPGSRPPTPLAAGLSAELEGRSLEESIGSLASVLAALPIRPRSPRRRRRTS